MSKLIAVLVAAMFGLGSVAGFAADSMKKDEMKKDEKAAKPATEPRPNMAATRTAINLLIFIPVLEYEGVMTRYAGSPVLNASVYKALTDIPCHWQRGIVGI